MFSANLIKCSNFEVNISISFPLIDVNVQLLVVSPAQLENKVGKAIGAMHEVWNSFKGF